LGIGFAPEQLDSLPDDASLVLGLSIAIQGTHLSGVSLLPERSQKIITTALGAFSRKIVEVFRVRAGTQVVVCARRFRIGSTEFCDILDWNASLHNLGEDSIPGLLCGAQHGGNPSSLLVCQMSREI
jgi:hypothetical protein